MVRPPVTFIRSFSLRTRSLNYLLNIQMAFRPLLGAWSRLASYLRDTSGGSKSSFDPFVNLTDFYGFRSSWRIIFS